MIDVGDMVAELIEAGCTPQVAAAVVARAFVAGANSTGIPRNPVDSVAEKRRAYDRERKRNSTGIPPESTGIPVLHREKNIRKSSMQNSERPSRGSRIAADWSPSAEDRQTAKDEGFSESEIDREALRFRDYWTAKAGAGGVKLDWQATWRNWVRNSAEKLGKTPSRPTTPGAATDDGKVEVTDPEQLQAWDDYARSKGGKSFPRNSRGGWRLPAYWPPGYKQPERANEIAMSRMQAMQ